VGSVASVMALNVALMTWLCGYRNGMVFFGSHSAWMFRWWRSDHSYVLGRYERHDESWTLYFGLQVPFSLVNKATVESIQQHLLGHSCPLIRPVHRPLAVLSVQGPVTHH